MHWRADSPEQDSGANRRSDDGFPDFLCRVRKRSPAVLAYSLNNQLGFMVVGIGLGTNLSLNGAVAHAFADIVFKSLLFMSMGAVLFRIGTVKASELGGLYKSMPWTTGFCLVGAASISAFPLFSGFVTKSMVLAAAMDGGHFWIWIALLFASAGVFHHAGIKIPYFAFFAHDFGQALPGSPFEHADRHGDLSGFVHRHRFISRVLLLTTAVQRRLPTVSDRSRHLTDPAAVLVGSGLYSLDQKRHLPAQLTSTNLDIDWLYRRPGRTAVRALGRFADDLWLTIRRTSSCKQAADCGHSSGAMLREGFRRPIRATWCFGRHLCSRHCSFCRICSPNLTKLPAIDVFLDCDSNFPLHKMEI